MKSLRFSLVFSAALTSILFLLAIEFESTPEGTRFEFDPG